jgi:hypothetical protein
MLWIVFKRRRAEYPTLRQTQGAKSHAMPPRDREFVALHGSPRRPFGYRGHNSPQYEEAGRIAALSAKHSRNGSGTAEG